MEEKEEEMLYILLDLKDVKNKKIHEVNSDGSVSTFEYVANDFNSTAVQNYFFGNR